MSYHKMMNTLQKLYENRNYPAKTKLYEMQRDADIGLTKKQVFEWIKNQEVHQITQDIKKKKPTNNLLDSPNFKAVDFTPICISSSLS